MTQDARTFWARLKAQLVAGRATPVVNLVPATPPPRAVVHQVELTAGPGVDWDEWERTRILRVCACRKPHRRCDDCAQFVCTAKPHRCPAMEGGGDEAA